MTWLTEFYQQDYEKWQQRTMMQIKTEHMQKGDNLTEEELNAIVKEEFSHE